MAAIEARCPRCAQAFPFTPAQLAGDITALRAEQVPAYVAHLAVCKGAFHVLAPTGDGWIKPIDAWADPKYWTDANHPAKHPAPAGPPIVPPGQ